MLTILFIKLSTHPNRNPIIINEMDFWANVEDISTETINVVYAEIPNTACKKTKHFHPKVSNIFPEIAETIKEENP